jgi:hypothetical protein
MPTVLTALEAAEGKAAICRWYRKTRSVLRRKERGGGSLEDWKSELYEASSAAF